MSIFTVLYNDILYRPLFNALIFLYNVIPGHDFGIAIISLTLIIRLILYPLNQRAIKSQKEMQMIQPKVKEIQEKFKNDKQKQGQALMELYKTHKVNPASGCLPILIQFPVLLALISVFRTGLEQAKLSNLYRFVASPGVVNSMFIGLIDLSKRNIVLAILAGAAQFIQSKMMMAKSPAPAGNDFAGALNKQMLYFVPALTTFLALSLPAGLALYWTAMTAFGIIQQYFVFKQKNG